MTKYLTIAAACVLFLSCSNRIDDTSERFEKVSVTLSLSSTASELRTAELRTKSSTNDLVAIQIYQRTSESGSRYKPFAFGLWDKMPALSVELNKDFIYKFEATIVPDGKSIVATSSNDGTFRQPFMVAGSGIVANNTLTYSTSNYFTGLGIGATATIVGKSYSIYNRPVADRYYGQKSELLATSSTSIDIELKRPVFGLRYAISNFNEGTVRVAINNAPDIVLTPQSATAAETIITFQGSAADATLWCGDEYEENISFSVFWQPASGAEVEVIARSQPFRRMQSYNLNIDLAKSLSQGGLNLTLEQNEMGDGGDIK